MSTSIIYGGGTTRSEMLLYIPTQYQSAVTGRTWSVRMRIDATLPSFAVSLMCVYVHLQPRHPCTRFWELDNCLTRSDNHSTSRNAESSFQRL
jgi:hypothetical protein